MTADERDTPAMLPGAGGPRRVLFRRRSDSARTDLLSCSRETGFAIALGHLTFDEERFFPPPAIHLRHNQAAFAVQGDRYHDLHGTAIYIGPLPKRMPGGDHAVFEHWFAIFPQIQDQTYGAPKIGSLRISRRGSIAWIQCQAGNDIDDDASVRRTCSRPGFKDRVRVHTVGTPANQSTQLDHGRDIDPTSLRIRGDVLTWRHSGKRRAARLP